MRFTLTIFTFLAFSAFAVAGVQKLRYKVIKDEKEIGQIIAVRTTEGETVIYDVETELNIRIILNQEIIYTSRAVYQNGSLRNSVAKSYVNDKLHHSCITNYKGGTYYIQTDKGKSSLNGNVTYSGVLLYFKEPGSVSQIFSEMSGQNNAVRKVGAGQYILTNSKSGKQNKYWYKGGILERAFLHHTLINIEIQRVN